MKIQMLNNSELENQLLSLVRQERKVLHLITLHICEVDKRKLYLEKARPSLYEYLVKDLGYSSSAAQRRIEAARLLKDLPTLAEKIQAGCVNLSQVGELSRALKQKQKEMTLQNSFPSAKITSQLKQDLLCKIENRNTFDTQRILSQELDLSLKPYEIKQVQKDESVHLQFTLSKEQYTKLQECKDLAGHLLLRAQLGFATSDIIDVLMDQFLKSKNVKAHRSDLHQDESTELPKELLKIQNAELREDSKKFVEKNRFEEKKKPLEVNEKLVEENKVKENKVKENTVEENEDLFGANQRTVEAKVKPVEANGTATAAAAIRCSNKSLTLKTRKIVLADKQCCQYREPRTQQICGSRFALEVEHITPRWAHGDHNFENLSVLCSQHNKLTYRKQAQVRLL